MLHPQKIFISKNNYQSWVTKQILTQVKKQQERNNMTNNSNDNINTINENSFTNENNSLIPEKYLSFIILPLYYNKKGNKVKKLLNPSRQLHIDLY